MKILPRIKLNDEFYELTLIEFLPDYKAKFICSCGKEHIANKYDARRGKVKSCGCLLLKGNPVHGLNKHPLYQKYHQMIKRCYNPNSDKFDLYGGRGISVCQKWLDDFMNFYNWAISHGWQEDLTIERKDVNGNYYPENCEWIPAKLQAKNRRKSVKITAWGETKNLVDWAKDKRCKVCCSRLSQKIKSGIPPEIAISTRERKIYDRN